MRRYRIFQSAALLILAMFLTAFSFIYAQGASAKVKVVASLPTFGEIAKEIGGDKVDVKSLAKGYQDPHFVEAKPSFILKLQRADSARSGPVQSRHSERLSRRGSA